MKKKNDLKPEDVTPEVLYLNRRFFLKTSIYAASAVGTASLYRYFRGSGDGETTADVVLPEVERSFEEPLTSYRDITNYNNFYEFTTDKESVAAKARDWKIQEWNLEVDGLVENPLRLNLKDISEFAAEERIYRFRCVEGWSMVIPWLGFPLQALLEKAKVRSEARYVAFESYANDKDMPNLYSAGIPFPYVEGLRLDEAMHPLTLMATGLYGKKMPNQNGAPIRLVVPWKYGFKSIKSVVKITLTDQEPPTTWSLASPREYGFYSNVNPLVDHPRWSQARERRIGESGMRPTLMFNGYEEEVASMYKDMDLRKYF